MKSKPINVKDAKKLMLWPQIDIVNGWLKEHDEHDPADVGTRRSLGEYAGDDENDEIAEKGEKRKEKMNFEFEK